MMKNLKFYQKQIYHTKLKLKLFIHKLKMKKNLQKYHLQYKLK